MPFVANSFVDGPAGGTPITAATLNNLEQGLLAADITNPASAAGVQLAAQLAAISLPSTLDATVAGYVGTSSATRTALITRGSVVNVKDFGAMGNKTTDDTVAIQNAINYAQALVRDIGTTQHEDGAVVYFPKGLYLISSSINVTVSNITIAGESFSSSVIYAPSANFNLVVFNNGTQGLYNCGISNIRISTPGNATAGYHLIVKGCIYFVADSVFFNGWFGGMFIAACGKMMSQSLIFSQESRANTTTTTGSAIWMATDITYNSDIHFTDLQIMEDIAYAGVNSFVVMGVDGLYIENAHIHGTFLVNPSGTGNDVVISTLVFSNVYFDGSRDANVILGGNPTAAYKDIRFSNCYFRAGQSGLRLVAATTISAVIVSNSTFAQNVQNGLEIKNHNVNDMIITGCIFFQNNASNSASYGDVLLNGNAVLMSNCDFTGGGALGTALSVAPAASYMIIANTSFINTAAGTKVANYGSFTFFKGVMGWNSKVKGTVTIPISATTYTLTHFCNITPVLESIRLTPGGSCPNFWVTAVGATTFQVNFASATAAAFTMGYMVDMEF